MSKCIVKFGSTVRAFRCSELETISLAEELTNARSDVIIIRNNEHIHVTFSAGNVKRCFPMAKELSHDDSAASGDSKKSDYFSEEDSPNSTDDCTADLGGLRDLKSGISRIFLLVHPMSDHKAMLSNELYKVFMDYLMQNWHVSIQLADFLKIVEITTYLLTHDLQDRETDIFVANYDLTTRQIVQCMAHGYKLTFNGIIDQIWDIDLFKRALGFGMRVTEINKGTYLTNDILSMCKGLEALNVDNNPYVTDLSPCFGTLKRLHCSGSSGIRQDQVNRCYFLKQLFANDNPHMVDCHSNGITVLDIRGKCGIDKSDLPMYVKLEELYVDFDDNIESWLPRNVTRLHLFSDTMNENSPKKNKYNYEQLEYLEINHTQLLGKVGPNLKTLICSDCIRIPDNDVFYHDVARAREIVELIMPNYTPKIYGLLKLKRLEVYRFDVDHVSDPRTLEVLKSNKIFGPRAEVRGKNDIPATDTDIDTINFSDTFDGRGNSDPVYSFDKFTRLRILHIDRERFTVKLSPGSPIRDLKCARIVGHMSGLELLVISGDDIPLKSWTIEEKASIRYLETKFDYLDLKDYLNIKAHKTIYRVPQYTDNNNNITIIEYDKCVPPLNPHDVYNNSVATLPALFDAIRLSGQFVCPEIFANIRTLELKASNDYILHCGYFSELQNLSVNAEVKLFALEKMMKLENLKMDLVSPTDDMYDYRHHLYIPKTGAVEDGYCDIMHISNPLLQTVKIRNFHDKHKDKLIIDSMWLKSLDVSDVDLTRQRVQRMPGLVVISSLHVTHLRIVGCNNVEIVGSSFLSLVEYCGDIPINFQGSEKTLKKITVPKSGKYDIHRWLDNYKNIVNTTTNFGWNYECEVDEAAKKLVSRRNMERVTYDSDDEGPIVWRPRRKPDDAEDN